MSKKIYLAGLLLSFLLSGCKTPNGPRNSGGPTHVPYMNPGGVNFSKDQEFFKSYAKLEGARQKQCDTLYPEDIKQKNKNDDDGMFPGAVLISEQKTKVLIRSESDKDWYNKNCIENADLPDDLKSMIATKCEAIVAQDNSVSSVATNDLPPVVNNNPSVPIVEENCDTTLPKFVDYESANKKKVIKKKSKSGVKSSKPKKPKKIDLCKQSDYEILSLDNIVNDCDKYSSKIGFNEISYKKNTKPNVKKYNNYSSSSVSKTDYRKPAKPSYQHVETKNYQTSSENNYRKNTSVGNSENNYRKNISSENKSYSNPNLDRRKEFIEEKKRARALRMQRL